MTGVGSTNEYEALGNLQVAGRLLGAYRPRRKLVRRVMKRAAVGLYLSDHLDEGVSVLMIRRAERDGDPWSGHMAFPGGRKEPGDRNTLATARRETHEEVALDAERHARLIGRLSDIVARARIGKGGMVVTPYVFGMHSVPEFAPNHEVDEILWVPLAFLAERSNRQKMKYAPNGIPLELPCYFYRERRIWGLSLMMLDELMEALV